MSECCGPLGKCPPTPTLLFSERWWVVWSASMLTACHQKQGYCGKSEIFDLIITCYRVTIWKSYSPSCSAKQWVISPWNNFAEAKLMYASYNSDTVSPFEWRLVKISFWGGNWLREVPNYAVVAVLLWGNFKFGGDCFLEEPFEWQTWKRKAAKEQMSHDGRLNNSHLISLEFKMTRLRIQIPNSLVYA